MLRKLTRDGVLLALDSALVIPWIFTAVLFGVLFESVSLVIYMCSFLWVFTQIVSIYERDREGLATLVRNSQRASTPMEIEVEPEPEPENIQGPEIPECYNKQISGS